MSKKKMIMNYITDLDLEDFVDKSLQDLVDAVKEIAGKVGDPDMVAMEISSFGDYDSFSTIEFSENRIETNGEFEIRIAKEKKAKELDDHIRMQSEKKRDERDRQEYARLKAKFEPKRAPVKKYECGNCNFQGPAYGIPTSQGVSVPFCPRCGINNQLKEI